GYGPSDRGNAEIVPLFMHAAWLFPRVIDEPLARHHLDLKWVIEPWVAGITDHSDAVEFGANLIFLKLDYDQGQRVVPFLSGGEGAMYTGLQGLGLAGPFEFSSAGGAGVDIFLTQQLALSLSYRFRHISNAGVKDPNRGLNTNFFLIGLEKF